MTFTYDLASGHLQASFDANNFQDVIKRIGYLDSVFRETKCGYCESEDIRLRMRETTEGHLYYEYVCQNPQCRAKLQVHERKDATKTMYLKKFADGQPLPFGGWEKWKSKAADSSGTGEPRDEEVPQPRGR